MVTFHLLPEAMGEAEEGAHMLEFFTSPQWHGWAQTISRGGTSIWKSWDELEHYLSMSHSWGAAVQ